MKIKRLAFPQGDYIARDKSTCKINQICLHHTVSNGTAEAVSDWFASDKGNSKVATPFVIALDGTVLQLFDPETGWAYHTGVYGHGDANCIGIEIVNAGPLVKKADKYYWCDGRYEYKGLVFDCVKPFRDTSRYWAQYTDAQMIAVAELCKSLIAKFGVKNTLLDNLVYDKKFGSFNGIISHVNIRPDKTDLSPAWDFNKFKELLNGKI